jgi:hypothetical protein
VRILGSSELQTIELSTQLQFVNGYQSGWVDFMAPPAALFIFFLWTMISHYYLMAWFCVVGYLLLVLWWLNTNVTKLYVTDTILVARGNLGHGFQNERRIPTEELKSFTYLATGAEGEVPGLYAIHAWTRTCLMPRLTEAEAKSIINTISRKFPHLEQGQLTRMASVHAEANGEFRPHVQTVEIDAVADLRKWKTQRDQELENEDLLRYVQPKPRTRTEDLES